MPLCLEHNRYGIEINTHGKLVGKTAAITIQIVPRDIQTPIEQSNNINNVFGRRMYNIVFDGNDVRV